MSYFLNILFTSLGFFIIVIQDFFLGFWGLLQNFLEFFYVVYNTWLKLVEIFYTALGYITGVIAFIFNFAETGGEDIFSS